jgi:hypothetical protein
MLLVNAPLGRYTESWIDPGQRCAEYMTTLLHFNTNRCKRGNSWLLERAALAAVAASRTRLDTRQPTSPVAFANRTAEEISLSHAGSRGDVLLAQVPCCTDEVAGDMIWEGFCFFSFSAIQLCTCQHHAACNTPHAWGRRRSCRTAPDCLFLGLKR